MSFPASIPLRRDPPEGASADSTGVSGMAALGLLLLVAVFAWAWWRKRRAAGAQAIKDAGTAAASPATLQPWGRWLGLPAAREVRTLGSTRLTAKHSLHEVQWQGRRLLIGCADQAICLLAETPDTPSGEATAAPQASQAPAPASAPSLAQVP